MNDGLAASLPAASSTLASPKGSPYGEAVARTVIPEDGDHRVSASCLGNEKGPDGEKKILASERTVREVDYDEKEEGEAVDDDESQEAALGKL